MSWNPSANVPERGDLEGIFARKSTNIATSISQKSMSNFEPLSRGKSKCKEVCKRAQREVASQSGNTGVVDLTYRVNK